MKNKEIECDNCGKIKKKGIYYWIFLSDGFLEACSKRCAKKLYDNDFLEHLEEKEDLKQKLKEK